MNEIREWIKKILKIIIIVSILLIIFFGCYIVYEQDEVQIGDKIQAWAIIALVVITGFYAAQTQRIVKEEKEKRTAEFGRIRIEDFLDVLKENLNGMRKKLKRMRKVDSGSASEIISVQTNFSAITKLLNERDYLATKPLNKALWLFKKNVDKGWVKQGNWEKPEPRAIWRDELLNRVKTIMKLVERERKNIISHIRKTYGYSTDKTIEKQD